MPPLERPGSETAVREREWDAPSRDCCSASGLGRPVHDHHVRQVALKRTCELTPGPFGQEGDNGIIETMAVSRDNFYRIPTFEATTQGGTGDGFTRTGSRKSRSISAMRI